MNFLKDNLSAILFFSFFSIVVVILVWAGKTTANDRAKCEARNGRYVSGRDFHIYLDKKSVIDLNN